MLVIITDDRRENVLGSAEFPAVPGAGDMLALETWDGKRGLYRVLSVLWPVNLARNLAGPVYLAVEPSGATLYPWISPHVQREGPGR